MTDNYEGCDCGGEHHTVGSRAWCLQCSEWCYPHSICEIQQLRNENAALRQQLADHGLIDVTTP
jgi:hypothetical protein